MRSCHDASRMMSRARDEPLGLLDRTLLQLHLSMCGNCRQVDEQLRVVDDLAGDLFGPTDDDAAGTAAATGG
jgi:hypothetical protein